MDFELTRRILAALEREHARYVVFGAVALAIHGLARATEDLDLFIEPDRENVERVKAALRSVFDDPCIDEITADDLLGEYPAVQYNPPVADREVKTVSAIRMGENTHERGLRSGQATCSTISLSIPVKSRALRVNSTAPRLRATTPIAMSAARFLGLPS